MLIDEEDIVLEARIQVWLKSKVNDDGIMMAVNMGVHPVESFEHLTDKGGKCLWKANA